MLKVLFINNFFSPIGGAEISHSLTYKLVKRQGIDAAYFATDKTPFFEQDLPYLSFFPPFKDPDHSHSLENLTNLPNVFYNRDVYKRLRQVIRHFKPTIAHVGNILYHLTPSVFDALRDEHIPCVLSVFDTRLFCPSGTLLKGDTRYCQDVPCIKGNSWHAVQHQCYQNDLIKSGIVALEFAYRYQRHSFSNVSLFITASEAMKALCIRSGIPPHQCVTLPHFVPNQFFDCSEQPFHSEPSVDTPYFLYMGRISKEKGLDCLVEAFTKTEGPHQLKIIGHGPQTDALKALVQSKQMAHRIHFHPQLDQATLSQQVKHCVATIIPSIWFEAFGRTVIETYAVGKPVIASKIGGLQSLIQHERTGLLVEPGNVDDLTHSIQTMIDHPEQVAQWGNQANDLFWQQYSENSYFPKLMALYETVLARPLG